ncbi:MAG: hypothetical protein IPL40_03680 [Proteobacteria bacterium]|nr:hypothetical protein [Pseudomonadota bacterium]
MRSSSVVGPKILRLFGAAFGCCALLACGASGDAGADLETDLDLVAERAAFLPHGQAPTVAATAKGVAALFVQEDPTLEPGASAATNAENVRAQVSLALTTCPAASISLSGEASLVVDFGAGCSVPGVGSLSGSVGVALTVPATHTIKVSFAFDAVQVDGRLLSGSLAVTTSDGTSFSFDAALQSTGGALTLDGAMLLLDVDGHGATLEGKGSYRPTAGSPKALTFAGVHHGFGDCYADAGRITSTKTTVGRNGRSSTVTETIAFGSSTPTTGEVQITVGKAAPVAAMLPSYGACPQP